MAVNFRTIGSPASIEKAYAVCKALAESHYENFTIASRLLPYNLRLHLSAVYAFCRYTDDLGDEAEGDRLVKLDDWEQDLSHVYGGQPKHAIMIALQDVVRRFEIPEEPFRKLIIANRMDQNHVRFATYEELLNYCAYSAMPVGQIVLYLLRDTTMESRALSDATCTALQLVNFWQDVARDFAMNRVYIPQEDLRRFGVEESELKHDSTSPALKDLLRFEIKRTQELFVRGLPLVNRVSGRMKLSIALFSKGGMSVLNEIHACDYDVLAKRPALSKSRKLWVGLSTAARLAILRRP